MLNNFDKLKYIHLIDQIELRNLEKNRQAKCIFDILEQFFDPILSRQSSLYIDEDYVSSRRVNEPNEFGISARQFYCRNAVLNNLKQDNLLDAYYEFIDFLLDYDDAHNNRFYRNELSAISEPYLALKTTAKHIASSDNIS